MSGTNSPHNPPPKRLGRNKEPAKAAPRGTPPRQTNPGAHKKQDGSVSLPPSNKKAITSGIWLVLALALLLAVTAWATRERPLTFVSGITIEGVNVRGMTLDQAHNAILRANEERITGLVVRLAYDGKTWNMNAVELGTRLELGTALEEGLALGHTGDRQQQREERARIKRDGASFTGELLVDEQRLDTWLQDVSAELRVNPQDATLQFDPTHPTKLFSMTTEEMGLEVDIPLMKKRVLQQIAQQGWAEVPVVMEQVEPLWTVATLEQCTKRIGYFETAISSGSTPDRISNIALSLSKFNGMVIEPGGSVSFNDTTGERSEANGYKMAPAINKDKQLEDALGGGVCQSSTTLYNAAILAGCEITERSRHSFPSSYVRKGFDAMVNWNSNDLVFKNVSEGPLFIRAAVEGRKCMVWIYGMPLPDGMECERVSEVLEEIPAPDKKVITDTNGQYAEHFTNGRTTYTFIDSHDGLRVKTYRVWKKGDEEIKKELLDSDYYKPIQGIEYVQPALPADAGAVTE